ncbi:MAG: LuxR C-terminal-related transcriptional regulator [Microbacteriaceae bacterium]
MSAARAELDALLDGRAAYSERRWEDAFSLLSIADGERALAGADLELLGTSASLTRREADAFRILDRTYQAFLDEHDELRASRVAFWHGYRLASLGELGQAEAWLGRSERLLERQGDCAERGYLLLPRIHRLIHRQDTDGVLTAAAEAMACGDRFSDADLSALARQLGGRALLEAGRVVEGMRLLNEAMLIATTESISELSKGLVYCAVVGCCQRVFAVDRAREWSGVLNAWCATQAQLGMFNGTCRVHRAELMQFGGDWSDSFDEAHGVTSGARADGHERAAALYQEAEIHRLRGDNAAAEHAYERASDLGGDPQPGLALLRLEQGRLEMASGAIRRAVDSSTTALGRAKFLPAHVEIMLAAGDLQRAAASAQDLAAIAALYDTPVLHAMCAQASGLVRLATGSAEDAVRLLQEALAIWQNLNAPYAAARTRVALAAAFAALGDSDGTRLEMDAARQAFTRLTAAPDLRRLSLSTPLADGPVGVLSARELGVLRIAATGKTNRQIATELGLSARTVDRHVSNILTKLGVPSRAAATAYAYENGLIRR